MLKNNKGITLIALVITIIVLLILAGVSIAMLTGDNGILTQSTTARADTEKAGIADKVNMAIQAAYTAHIANANGTASMMDISEVKTQYNDDNEGTSQITNTPTNVTTANQTATLTISEGTKTYTVTVTRVGNSYTTSKDAVQIGSGS